MRRPVLFYSAWPLGYHNRGAERRAAALAGAGYDVAYVAGIGIRNPRLSSGAKLIDRTARKLRAGGARAPATQAATPPPGVREAAVLVLPPRQYRVMRRLNGAWLERQLRSQLEPWEEALAWIRWPTPELVDVLPRLNPAGVIFEAFDAYDATPGITGRWRAIHERAERDLVELVDLVVVPGEKLAERYRALGATVRVIPPGVDLIEWRGRQPSGSQSVVVGFVGTIDDRLSVPVLRAVAAAHPEWRVRLIGPIQGAFDRRALADLPNISLEPPIPAEEVPRVVASFDLGIMPYNEDSNTAHMVPVKNLEYLAAGVPAVARRIMALEPYQGLLYFADTPEEFVTELERALASDNPELAEARRRAAEPHGWPSRLEKIVAAANDISGGPEY